MVTFMFVGMTSIFFSDGMLMSRMSCKGVAVLEFERYEEIRPNRYKLFLEDGKHLYIATDACTESVFVTP